jgi:hypothetical protein
MGNEPTIDQMNEAIALFDGWEFRKGDPDHKCNFCFAGDEPCTPAVDRFVKGGRIVFHYEVKYHKSWDLLMPVFEKINQIWVNYNRTQQKQIEETYRAIQNRILLCSILEAAELIAQFIQWFNKNKPNGTE